MSDDARQAIIERIIETNYYLTQAVLYITSDKRWFGRYVWCRFTKEDKNLLSFGKKVF